MQNGTEEYVSDLMPPRFFLHWVEFGEYKYYKVSEHCYIPPPSSLRRE